MRAGYRIACRVVLPGIRLFLLGIAIPLEVLAFVTQPVAAADDRADNLPETVDFNRDLRPLLSDNCFACHGPDKNKREAELRLDTQKGLLGAADHEGVVSAGRPNESELFRRITTGDPEERMPPPDSGKSLSERDVQLIRRWIEQGAAWEGHWAFNPIKRPAPPAPRSGNGASDFIQNPIDAFVVEGLREQGLAPSPQADRRTLIRRLSFDLTGLPPSIEEVEQFVADPGPRAYDDLVDRLLVSPRFGERMAIWWLDLVRYADSVGYHGDQPMSVFPFRDFVIDSFNSGKRFDQFTIEQLAGDLLPDPTLAQQIASGYNRLGMMSAEGGVQDKEYLAKYIAERVRNASGTWLGITLGCCECHDHKYDPFTTRDFYRFEAFFADIQERGLYSGAHVDGSWGPRIQLPTPEQAAEASRLDAALAEARQAFETPTEELAAAQQEWEKAQAVWTVLKTESQVSTGGAALTALDDGSILAGGLLPSTDAYSLVVLEPSAGITALRLEALPDDKLPKKGPGRAAGNFVLTELVVKFQPAGEMAEQPIPEQLVPLQNATASYEQTAGAEGTPHGKWSAADAIDGDAKGAGFGWAILDQVGKPHHAVFETAADIAGGPGSRLTITLLHNHENPGHALGRFRLSATSSPRPVGADASPPPAIGAILAVAASERSEQQRQELAAHYRSVAPLLEPVRAQLKELETARAELNMRIPTTLVTVGVTPRMIRILPRGNWMNDSGDVVEPAVPASLPQPTLPPEAPGRMTRLDLARWLMSPENPLTARVFVNRQWKLFFGAGLSRRLDDVGMQGEWPSHPLLLDWLAGKFIDSGWDVKEIVRLIVMSGTYRQSSLAGPELREADPFNRWLARQGSFRLDAEMVRDNALAVGGLLVERVGGASVRPYQPPGYWAHLNFPAREWENGTGDDLYRRGLYTHWQRQYLHPSLLAFDAPSREECTADRPRSNTPLQSLALLNDPTYVEAARAFAERVLCQGGESVEQKLDWAFRRAVARPIRADEAQVLLALLESHRAEYRQDPAAAAALMTVGAKAAPTDLDSVELAAWTSVTRAILNLHETITRN